MAKEMPLHDFESVSPSHWDGHSWIVEERHHGHTMTVLGSISANGVASSMVLVECSCGDRFRMASVTVEKALGV